MDCGWLWRVHLTRVCFSLASAAGMKGVEDAGVRLLCVHPLLLLTDLRPDSGSRPREMGEVPPIFL